MWILFDRFCILWTPVDHVSYVPFTLYPVYPVYPVCLYPNPVNPMYPVSCVSCASRVSVSCVSYVSCILWILEESRLFIQLHSNKTNCSCCGINKKKRGSPPFTCTHLINPTPPPLSALTLHQFNPGEFLSSGALNLNSFFSAHPFKTNSLDSRWNAEQWNTFFILKLFKFFIKTFKRLMTTLQNKKL